MISRPPFRVGGFHTRVGTLPVDGGLPITTELLRSVKLHISHVVVQSKGAVCLLSLTLLDHAFQGLNSVAAAVVFRFGLDAQLPLSCARFPTRLRSPVEVSMSRPEGFGFAPPQTRQPGLDGDPETVVHGRRLGFADSSLRREASVQNVACGNTQGACEPGLMISGWLLSVNITTVTDHPRI